MAATTLTPQVIATVVSVQGEAYVRNPQGELRLLKAGDALYQGEVVETRAGGQVELAMADGQMLAVMPNETFLLGEQILAEMRPVPEEAAVSTADIQRVIQALEQGLPIDEELEAAAAGVSGGGDNAGHSFVRLTRVAEGVDPLAFEFPYPLEAEIREPGGVAALDEPGEPLVDSLPIAEDDLGGASVLLIEYASEGGFNNASRVMGAGEGAESFEIRLGHEKNDGLWLLSDASFKKGSFEGPFTITDKGAGGDPAFVVTPNFLAEVGDEFKFSASTHLQTGDAFTVEVYKMVNDAWVWWATIADGSYTFSSEGEYRVKFTVDDNTRGSDKATATINIETDGYFMGESSVTYEYEITPATGYIFGNDTLGDGSLAEHTWEFENGVVDPDDGSVTVAGLYGTLVVDASGNYVYTPSGSSGGTEQFNYVLTDVDGDSDPATLTITVQYSEATGYDATNTVDYMLAREGADVFKWEVDDLVDGQKDTVQGFSSGDTLDFSDLLTDAQFDIDVTSEGTLVTVSVDAYSQDILLMGYMVSDPSAMLASLIETGKYVAE